MSEEPPTGDSKYRLLLEQASDGIFVVDAGGRYVEANAAACAMLGYTREELLGLTIRDVVDPADQASVPVRFDEMRSGTILRVEQRLRRKDGSVVSVELSARTIEGGGFQAIVRDVSGRLAAEERLRESEARYRDLFENAADVVYTLDLEGNVVSVNRAVETVFGFRPEELIGKNIERRLPEDQRETVRRMLAMKLQGGIPRTNFELQLLTRDGSRTTLEVSGRVVVRDGRPVGIGGIARDVTQRKRDELVQASVWRIAQAASSTESLQELIGRIHEILAGLMPARNLYVALVDDRTSQVEFPYFVDEFDPPPPPRKRGRTLTDFVLRTGEPLLAHPAAFLDLVRAGEVEPTGAPSIDWLGVPLRAGNETIGVLAVQSYTEGVRFGPRDVEILRFVSTQVAMAIRRKRAEEAIRESETKFRLLFENSADASFLLEESVFTDCNQAVVDMFHAADKAAILGKHPADFSPGRQPDGRLSREKAEEMMASALGGASHRFEWVHLRADGEEFPAEVVLTPVSIPGRRTLHAVVRDITEQKRAERAILQASRMEAAATLAGGVAHDFNNLMAGVLGNAELLRAGFAGSEEALERLDDIAQAARRAGELAQQMLAFARGGRYQARVMSLNETVKETTGLQARSFPARISLETKLDPGLWNVEADPSQVSQVAMNLCLNASEAISGHGRISVRTGNLEADAALCARHAGLVPGRYALLTVEDDGHGMAPETAARVFEPFFTTKFQGRGLGLAAVWGIVKNHGGYIWVESEEGRGTAFHVLLPATWAPTAKPVRRVEGPKGGDETILIVDDDRMVLKVTSEILERLGYRILTAPDGAQAVRIAREHDGEIHLALLDLGMPVLGGAEAYPLLMTARRRLKVLVCSGYDLDASARAVLDAGAQGFVQKPFRTESLAHAIRRALDA